MKLSRVTQNVNKHLVPLAAQRLESKGTEEQEPVSGQIYRALL